jgi:hypothetical protein
MGRGGEDSVSTVANETLEQLRQRLMPMLRLVAAEYAQRVPEDYPIIVDSVANGLVGIEIDPNYALYFTVEGDQLYADIYWRSSRYDARTSASREKFAGSPLYDRRRLPPSISDIDLRNLIAELMSRYNFQQGVIHISDS